MGDSSAYIVAPSGSCVDFVQHHYAELFPEGSREQELDVEIVPPDADKRAFAECDLGVTGMDAALPETGALVLRASPEHPQMVLLLPRVHLTIVHPAALRADLHQVLDEVKSDKRDHFITGPSRTADIEKTLTIGVHGPKALYVWVWLGG